MRFGLDNRTIGASYSLPASRGFFKDLPHDGSTRSGSLSQCRNPSAFESPFV